MRTTDTVAGAGLTTVSVATAVTTHKKEGAIEEDRVGMLYQVEDALAAFARSGPTAERTQADAMPAL